MSDVEQPSRLSKRLIIGAAGTAVVIALGAAAIVTDGAGAFGDSQLDDGKHLLSEAEISPEEAIEIALSDVTGEVDDVDLKQSGNDLIYEIEIDDTDVHVDARTGDLLYIEHDNDDDFTARQQTGTDDTSADPSGNADSTDPAITTDEAIEIALTEVEGQVEGVELDRENGRLLYEVEINDRDVYVDVMDGTILYIDHDDDDDSDAGIQQDSGAQAASAEISVEQAIEIAHGEVDGRVDDVELDHENGRLVYEIEIGNHEVYVDAIDGSVLRVSLDD